MTSLPRLYAIADASFGDPVGIADALFRGGALLVQVRNKNAGAGELLEQVEQIMTIAPRKALVIVNDRVDVAYMAGAGGVHLGQDDMPAAAARQILGPHAVIGVSTHTLEQATEADNLPVDYIAAGPVFTTTTKKNADPLIGIEGVRVISKASRKPVVAIGGITPENCGEVFAAGAQSVALIRSLLEATDIAAQVRACMQHNQSWFS